MCYLFGQAHDGLQGLGGSVSELEILPTSPDSLCTKRDDGLSTDLGLSDHSRLLPSPWGMHPSQALHDDKELPTQDPGTGTKASFLMTKARRHHHVTLTKRNGLPLRENPLVLSHQCRDLMYSRPKGITSDAAATRHNSPWNCWRLQESNQYEQETDVPALSSNPTPCQDK